MTTSIRSSIACCTAAILLGGCASAPRSTAAIQYGVITGYHDVSYNPRHPIALTVQIDSVNGKHIAPRDIPVRLSPGDYSVVATCRYEWPGMMNNETQDNLTLTVKKGHLYMLHPVMENGSTACSIKVWDKLISQQP
ncbi:MAG: hypothetical protein ACRES7_12165 [Gammaproteobacteria bacterium]